MRRILSHFFVLFLVTGFFPAAAQYIAIGDKNLKKEQERFLRQLKYISADTVITYPLARYFESEVNALYTFITADGALTPREKEKAFRSLGYFMQELSKNMMQQKSDLYDIPGALQSYKSILTALLYHKPIAELMIPLRPRRSQLLTVTFSQYKEFALLNDIAMYKRVASSPEFILQFLENKPEFRFADSLLLNAAAYDPLKLAFYLNRNKPGVQEKIRNSPNVYLQQIVTVSKHKSASELLPFVTQIAENKITLEEILDKRTDVVQYFQLLVNTLMQSRGSADSSSVFINTLRNGLKQKSLAFYVNNINELHNSSDAVRFASVKGLRPEDLYYIITSSGDELYTSSYLGLYKRLMEHFKDKSSDLLFEKLQYDNFRIFMRLAANYNVLSDFLSRMPIERVAALLNRFIAGIEGHTDSGLEKAMDIADLFAGLGTDAGIIDLVQHELESNLERCTAERQYLGIRLYSILLQVFTLVKQDDAENKLWTILGNYELLKREALENKSGGIVQLVLFYGDEDGVSSFNNFLKLYTDAGKWNISNNDNWVSIRSLSDHPVIIYANKPLDIKEELDLKAQDSLIAFLQEQSLEPAVLIHRGHSYHLDKTLKRLKPSVKLAILGSCGGYNKAISLASINPDIQVIGSKKTGSKSINDPIIDMINETLLDDKDLSWPEIWKKLLARFSKDESALTLFNEYFPPSSNISLFVLKLFIFYNRFL